MKYLFKGSLCGYFCEDSSEPLDNMEVLLYLPWQTERIVETVVADTKETFHLVTIEEAERRGSPIATAKTDANGNFEFILDEKYANTAFDIDFVCGTIPRTPPRPPRRDPIKIHLTTVYPQWRVNREQESFFFRWDYCIPHKWWCHIRGYYFDAWIICGHLRDCETRKPIANVNVTAWDADFLTDDNLGTAITDANGYFRIDYTSIQFKQTFLSPWINVETDPGLPLTFQSGPDVYFKAEIGGVNLLDETAADNRKNVGYCLCVELCVELKPLKCELTDPTDCTAEESDPVVGNNFVRVMGTASGGGFSNYTLEILQTGSPIPGVSVKYPSGGASGTLQVVGGELGQINTTGLADGAYTIRLTVNPFGLGVPSICLRDFTLLKVFVYMNKVGKITTDPQPLDPTAELRNGGVPKAVGGVLSIEGAAYVYGCIGRQIKKYDIRTLQVAAPGTEPAQPATDDPTPAGWSIVPPLPLEYTLPDQYQTWTRVGPASRDLINSWKTFTIGGTTYYGLTAGQWGSPAVSGRYSMLLVVEDTVGHLYYDIQHVWIDNNAILGQIVKFQRLVSTGPEVWADIPTCMDLMVSLGTIRIVGLAWDPIIDTAWWPPVAPNNNFSYYRLDFWKQFGPSHELLGNTTVRVPALPALPPVAIPTVADAGELARWDLTTLDAGALPSPYVPPDDPKIYRGQSCTYDLQLFVTDSTAVNDNSSSNYKYHQVPVKIVNDL